MGQFTTAAQQRLEAARADLAVAQALETELAEHRRELRGLTETQDRHATSITDNELAIARLRETVEALTAGAYGHANDSAVHHKHEEPPVVWFARGEDDNTRALFRPISPVAQRVDLPGYMSKHVTVNSRTWSIPLYQARPDDGPRTILARANGQYQPEINVTIPFWLPGALPDPERDAVLLMLMPDGRTLYELYGVRGDVESARAIVVFDVIDGSAFNAIDGWPKHKYDETQPHGTRAGGVSQSFAVLRPEHITGEGRPHALAVGFGAKLLGPPLRSAYVFPAISADWWAARDYEGSNEMGTRIGTDIDCRPLMRTDFGRTVAATLWSHGAFAMDLAGPGGSVVIYADPSLASVAAEASDDMDVLGQHIRKLEAEDGA